MGGGAAIVVVLLLLFLGRRRPAEDTPPAGVRPTGGGTPRPGGGFGLAGGGGRPPGDPPPYRAGCRTGQYDQVRWPSRAAVLAAFGSLGYEPSGTDTMNDLGPDGVLGGGDDVPSVEVRAFQRAYNRAGVAGYLGASPGGLDEDGLVGPCTLAAVGVVLDRVGAAQWLDVVRPAVGG